MRKLSLVTGLFALALWGFPGAANAASVTCPNPALGDTAQTDNQYTVDPALDCVYGDGNIGQGNPLQDQFIQGNGNLEDDYTAPAPYDSTSPTWGLEWTLVCSSTGTTEGTCTGLDFTVNASLDAGTWNVTDTQYEHYALGIVDGAGPPWAVFLLDPNNLSGTMSMVGGAFSHFVLYGSGTVTTTTTDIPVSEPASLLLLGAGLALTARRFRRRQQAQPLA